MNSLLLISLDQAWGFKPILSGKCHPQLLSKIHQKFIKNSSRLYQLFVTFTVSYDTDRPSCPHLHKGRIFNI
ncbi:hypothetical protein [Microcoleus sp. Pol11C3]|uniref:hypothetical protein n=1 Tax=Microcoleus sp. Pol11C3 TaxID=3055390 RepID=UPI002FD6500C